MTNGAIGVVLHPDRDCSEAVAAIAAWSASHGLRVLGLPGELGRAGELVEPVDPDRLADEIDLLVSLGSDGTMATAPCRGRCASCTTARCRCSAIQATPCD
jgi:NAD+ kinase